MADVVLSGFQSPVAELSITNRFDIHVLVSAFTPMTEFRPVLEWLQASGRNGYRSRIVHLQPREFRLAGYIGTAGMADARNVAENLQKSQLSYGDVEFTPSVGVNVRMDTAHLVQVRAQPVNADLRTDSATYTACVFADLLLAAIKGAP